MTRLIKRQAKFPNFTGLDKELDSLIAQFNNIIGSINTNVGTPAENNDGLVGTKDVDETNINNDYIVVYKTSSDKLEYEPKPSGSGTPASTIVNETSYAQSSAVGVLSSYAREDHTHGTPAAPTKTSIGLSNVTNDLQIKASDLDVDGTLGANSDTKVSSQKAVKTYVDGKLLTLRSIFLNANLLIGRSAAATNLFVGANARSRVFSFSGSADQGVWASIMVPYDWASGALTFILYLANSSTSGNNIVFRFYILNDVDAGSDLSSITGEIVQADIITPSTTQYELFKHTHSISITPSAAGKVINILLIRLATNADDTNTSAIYLQGIEIKYASKL